MSPILPRRAALGLALLSGLIAAPAAAHDFWLQPQSYWLAPRATTPMTLQVGHGAARQRSPIKLGRITRFTAAGPDGGVRDLRAALSLGAVAADGVIGVEGPGAYVVVLETDAAAQSHLPAARYNAYLADEGLTPAQTLRDETHRTEADGAERYRRVAKLLIQTGSPSNAGPDRTTEAVGSQLEIVPDLNPYARPATLPIHVIYEGRPLAGALVKLTDLDHDAEPVEVHRTDGGGGATFAAPDHGRWLLNVIWTKPLGPDQETDFETVFSSLSFGFPAP